MSDVQNNPLVSVIIPVYKVEKYIERCLDSVISQTYKNLEIILIDDGSPDNSGKICDEYQKKDARIRVIHKENGGVSSARNEGLRVATGDYIGFVDSDDYIDPKMYETLVNNAIEYDADISICGFYNDYYTGSFERNFSDSVLKTFNGSEQLKCLLKNDFYSCSIWDRIIKKDIINSYFDESITNYEDLLFLYYVTGKSQKTVFDSQPYYYYTTNEGSAAISSFSHKKMSMITAWELILNDVKKHQSELSDVARTEFVRNNLMCAGYVVRDCYDNKEDLKRIRHNVRSNLIFYLFSYAAIGYKVNAVALSASWKLFSKVINRGRK